MTIEELEKLEALHADGTPEAADELHNAFPSMAKALREAWEERDTAIEELIAASREIEQIKRERDEARAEVERLKTLQAKHGP